MLSHCENDIEQPTITPSVMKLGERFLFLPKENLEDIEDLRNSFDIERICFGHRENLN